MKIIRCTGKLHKAIGVEPQEDAKPASWLESWHANLVRIDRQDCLIVTNDETLYTIFIPGLSKVDLRNLPFIINESLFKSMINNGLSQSLIEKVLSVGDEIVFTKTNSRSVLGSMNDMKRLLEYKIYDNGGFEYCNLIELQTSINRVPMGALKYELPIEAFLRKLK